MTGPCNLVRLGTVDYMEAWDLQKRLAEQVKAGGDGWRPYALLGKPDPLLPRARATLAAREDRAALGLQNVAVLATGVLL